MRKSRVVTLRDTRPEPKWSFPRRAVAIALDCQPTDVVVTTVREEVLAALAKFRGVEHWIDRVSNPQRVRALLVIRRALTTALEQCSELDAYTAGWLSGNHFRFDQRLHELCLSLDSTGFGVFTRNHRQHLEEAVVLCASDPERRVVFRSAKRWVSAAQAVVFGVVVPLYIATVGGSGIEYEAELVDIQLDPREGDPTTKRLLALDTASTKGEELWPAHPRGKTVNTLYVLKGLRSVTPFPISQLTKATGGRLDKGYRYSYALVKVTE